MSAHTKDSRFLASRRELIKWAAFTGAALGLPRWKVFEVLEASGGTALAAEAACAPTNRSVHLVAGNGGFAWFQLLWPHNDVAAAANGQFAFHAPGLHTMAAGTDKPLSLGPEAPWKALSGSRQVTALMAGNNETHTNQPVNATNLGNNVALFAACSALQAANPTLVPVIAIDNVPFGNATGAARPARVGDAGGIVELFNSAASRAGGILENEANGGLYYAAYDAFLQLHKAANRPTSVKAFNTGRVAAKLLGQNLAAQLRPSDGDLARYGVNGGTANKLREIARTLITTAKAFQLGLTSSVVLPAMRDDPHGAFGDMADLQDTVATLGSILDGFYNDLAGMDDATCAGSKIADNTVITINGDTPKNPLARGGWPDGTPQNSNWIYVLGAGQLKSGWFGGVMRDGTVQAYDPTTGENTDASSNSVSAPSSAAVLYAIAKGDMRRVQDFYRGAELTGIVRPVEM